MIQIGRHSLKPWVKGLAAAPQSPAVLCLVKNYHDARGPEVLSVEAVRDLRAGLADFTARGALSRAITQHRTTGSAIQLASAATTASRREGQSVRWTQNAAPTRIG